MKIGVVRFPGTNCDYDIFQAVQSAGHEAQWLWHQDQFQVRDVGAIVLPGGFSYGDYLRTGALAAKAPVMKSVAEAAQFGTPILGICNGFQILCETGLLPGVLVTNVGQRFIDAWVDLEVVNQSPIWPVRTANLRLPIAHGMGRFYAEDDTLKRIFDQGQVWLRYINNLNGALRDVAGVMNEKKNVVGLMPHPERALFEWMGGSHGLQFFQNVASV